MTERSLKLAYRPAAAVAMVLFTVAAVTYWDASQMTARATYGMGANAASYFICLFLAVLGIGHLFAAFQTSGIEAEDADWKAIGWIAVALSGLIGSIFLAPDSSWARPCCSRSRHAPSAARRCSPISPPALSWA
ncbi:glucan phosphoethanolaminetransferase (alkaline phosphatase superfamily) [Sinorhizobium fredii]